jgi:ribosomal protein S18 acetylase RimI-like enzyme
MPIRPRPYADDDLPALQAALAGWIASAGVCGYCHIGELPHRIYENLRGRLPVGELVQIWEDAGRIAGVAICGRFGAAFDVFAAPELRGAGQERAMLEAACATTRRLMPRLGAEGQPVITDVFGCDDTRKAQLAALGFAPYRQWDDITERSLEGALPEASLPEGFRVRCAAPGDYAQLAAVRNAAFGAGWSPEQYRDEVMRKPGYEPERELVAVAPGGQIAAFTVIWPDALNRTGLFEPVGTHPEFQRLGLARALMAVAMRQMRREGMRTATVAHDATNQPARALYRSLGFQKTGETFGYQQGAS